MNSKSWRTTSTGVLAIIVAAGSAALAMVDGNPQTVPQWETTMTSILAGIGLLFARDNNKTSEDVGLK